METECLGAKVTMAGGSESQWATMEPCGTICSHGTCLSSWVFLKETIQLVLLGAEGEHSMVSGKTFTQGAGGLRHISPAEGALPFSCSFMCTPCLSEGSTFSLSSVRRMEKSLFSFLLPVLLLCLCLPLARKPASQLPTNVTIC